MVFSNELDTWLHTTCAIDAHSSDPDHPEARIILRELAPRPLNDQDKGKNDA